MFDQYSTSTLLLLVFVAGLILGVALTLLINKLRTGSASPVKLKKEMDDYQGKVDAHFAETSKKFKQMTTQYQDLYQHLAAGATTLCRPDTIPADLIEGSSALQQKPAIEQKTSEDKAAKDKAATPAVDGGADKKASSVDKPAATKENSKSAINSQSKEQSATGTMKKQKPSSKA